MMNEATGTGRGQRRGGRETGTEASTEATAVTGKTGTEAKDEAAAGIGRIEASIDAVTVEKGTRGVGMRAIVQCCLLEHMACRWVLCFWGVVLDEAVLRSVSEQATMPCSWCKWLMNKACVLCDSLIIRFTYSKCLHA